MGKLKEKLGDNVVRGMYELRKPGNGSKRLTSYLKVIVFGVIVFLVAYLFSKSILISVVGFVITLGYFTYGNWYVIGLEARLHDVKKEDTISDTEVVKDKFLEEIGSICKNGSKANLAPLIYCEANNINLDIFIDILINLKSENVIKVYNYIPRTKKYYLINDSETLDLMKTKKSNGIIFVGLVKETKTITVTKIKDLNKKTVFDILDVVSNLDEKSLGTVNKCIKTIKKDIKKGKAVNTLSIKGRTAVDNINRIFINNEIEIAEEIKVPAIYRIFKMVGKAAK